MSTCRSCQAEIVWVVTSQGRHMPCDAKAVQVLVQTGRSVDIGHGPEPEYEVRRGYVSHFATCPNAEQHRKTK